MNNYKLHHEQLDVYQASIKFLALSAKIIENLPRGNGALTDQLKRASLSIPLNISEGYGKRAKQDRNRFYDIARGSAHECAAVLDAAKIIGIINESTFSEGKQLIFRIVSMLVKMV